MVAVVIIVLLLALIPILISQINSDNKADELIDTPDAGKILSGTYSISDGSVGYFGTSKYEFDGKNVKYYDYGYDYYLEKRDIQEEKVVEEKVQKVKRTYINPLKEKEKIEKKITKLEEKIMQKEEEKENLQNELLKEEIYTDYVKVGEINNQILVIDKEIEQIMLEWEKLSEELEIIKQEL